MKEVISKRFLKALLIGGPMAVGMFFSLVAFVGMYGNNELYEVRHLAITLISFLIFLLATFWATGFWGRWGMLVFFMFAPLILVVDFTVNPLAPVGSIIVSSIFLWLTESKGKGSSQY